LPQASDPKIQQSLTFIQHSDPKTFRLFGLDLNPDHLNGQFLNNFNLNWQRTVNAPLADDVQTLKTTLPKTFLNSKMLMADVGLTSTHISMGVVESQADIALSTGTTFEFYQKQVLFKLKTGTLVFTLSTTLDLKDALAPGFDAMLDQIQMLP